MGILICAGFRFVAVCCYEGSGIFMTQFQIILRSHPSLQYSLLFSEGVLPASATKGPKPKEIKEFKGTTLHLRTGRSA